jgi:hypothetical protein
MSPTVLLEAPVEAPTVTVYNGGDFVYFEEAPGVYRVGVLIVDLATDEDAALEPDRPRRYIFRDLADSSIIDPFVVDERAVVLRRAAMDVFRKGLYWRAHQVLDYALRKQTMNLETCSAQRWAVQPLVNSAALNPGAEAIWTPFLQEMFDERIKKIWGDSPKMVEYSYIAFLVIFGTYL